MYRQALELKEKVLGPENPSILGNMNNLALMLQHQGKYNKVEQMYWQTLELKEKVLGPNHHLTLNIRHDLTASLEA
ncbi:tetratricopeptide repeat domain protein [Colletotrichum sublineola]|nr:tetratricopeptide repeat domain protein [Colletotrichum sublineola]